MDSFRVVPKTPLRKTSIEGGNVEKKLPAMIVGVLFLHGTVESFAVCVLFRRLRTGLVVCEVENVDRFSEVFLELAPIVRENEGKWEREYLPHDLEELGRRE